MAAVSRSKRSFEEGQEENQLNAKRQHYTKHCFSPFEALPVPSSSSSGIAACAVCSVTASEPNNSATDDSIVDDTILDFSDEDLSDSPTGLSFEAEDELLLDSVSCCLETSSSSIALEPDTGHVGHVCDLTSFKLSETLNETIKTKPLSYAGPLICSGDSVPCRNDSMNPEGGSDLNTDSENQAGLGLGSDNPGLPEILPVATVSLSLEKGSDVSGVTDREAAQAVIGSSSSQIVSQPVAESELTNAVVRGPSEKQASICQNELGRESASSPPQEAEGVADSAGLHGEAAASRSNSVSDDSNDHVKVPTIKELNCSIRPRERIHIQETDLELRKEKYISAVVAHVRSAEHLIGEVNELYMLMGSVAAENCSQEPRYQHPTDLTVRYCGTFHESKGSRTPMELCTPS